MEAFEKLKYEETLVFVDGNRTPDLIATDIWKEVLHATHVSSDILP
jgi:hypothetical protein